MIRFGLSFFWLGFATFPGEAQAYALSCTNAYNYTYFTEDSVVASKCKFNFDQDCVWKNTANNCKWQGNVKGPAKGQGSTKKKLPFSRSGIPEPTPQAREEMPNSQGSGPGDTTGSTATGTPGQTDSFARDGRGIPPLSGSEPIATQEESPTISHERPAEDSVQTQAESRTQRQAEDTKKKKEIEEAKKEAKISFGKVEELKFTMEEIKVNNQNNAVLYRSPDAKIGSVDPRFNAFGAGLSGEIGSPSAEAGVATGGLLESFSLGKNTPNKEKIQKGEKYGRGIASADDTAASLAKESEASAKGEASSATSDNPWVTYMGQTSKAGLIDRLRKNPKLRDSLRDRIAELQASGDQSGVVELMEETLARAEKESQSPHFDDLKPMAFMEAFSMDSDETEAQIRSLIADLDTASDPQFLPQASLFERVSVAHRRSLLRGTVRPKH